MDQQTFDEQFKILLAEYKSLNKQLETATDPMAIKRQMHDCVRRQNALREQLKSQGV